MKFSADNKEHSVHGNRRGHILLFEKAILFSLVLMCLISIVDAFSGRNVGNPEHLRMAKLHATQELMALRAGQGR